MIIIDPLNRVSFVEKDALQFPVNATQVLRFNHVNM